MIQKVVPGMCERKFGRVVNISVSFIRFPQVNFGQSHAARLALAGAIAAMVRELVPHNVVINSVLPGFFDTDALQTNLHGHAARGNTTYEAIVEDRLKSTPCWRSAMPPSSRDGRRASGLRLFAPGPSTPTSLPRSRASRLPQTASHRKRSPRLWVFCCLCQTMPPWQSW
jgi:NAD(P)-dependent dehydrogenase (short-subunit alcohol dehydrogenase family)